MKKKRKALKRKSKSAAEDGAAAAEERLSASVTSHSRRKVSVYCVRTLLILLADTLHTVFTSVLGTADLGLVSVFCVCVFLT